MSDHHVAVTGEYIAKIERENAELHKRVAELEGALTETQALEMNHEGAVVRLMREKEAQTAELERLRIFSNLARIANDEPYMAETGYKLRRAFEYLDRAPAAQAEPQAAPKAGTCTCGNSIGSHYRNSDKHECHHGNCPCEAFFPRPAEPQAARLAQVGDEVWYRPFRNMKEREAGRMVKVTKRGKYEFRVEDGRVIHPWESDDAGTWLRDANFGNTWWWSREDEPQDTGDHGFHGDGGK